jgi:hypothetical protein
MAPRARLRPAQEESREVRIEMERDKNERIRKRRGAKRSQFFLSAQRRRDNAWVEVFLYRAEFIPGINVVTFIPGCVLA